MVSEQCKIFFFILACLICILDIIFFLGGKQGNRTSEIIHLIDLKSENKMIPDFILILQTCFPSQTKIDRLITWAPNNINSKIIQNYKSKWFPGIFSATKQNNKRNYRIVKAYQYPQPPTQSDFSNKSTYQQAPSELHL